VNENSSHPEIAITVDQDQMACNSARDAAVSMCQGLGSVVPQQTQVQPGEAITAYCERMKSSASSATNANSSAGMNCMSQHTNCSSKCDSLANFWSAEEPSAANSMRAAASHCRSLDSYAQAAGRQGASLTNNSHYAQYCSQQGQSLTPMSASATPASLGSSLIASQKTATDNLRNQETEAAKLRGLAKHEELGDKLGKLNVAAASAVVAKKYEATKPDIPAIPINRRQDPVPNNTGGPIPGGSGAGAQLSNKPSPGSPGYKTDVLQGTKSASQSGGGGSLPAGKSDSGGFAGYDNGRTPAEENIDLRQFLPGGRQDPGAKLGGGFRSASNEINGPHVNVWTRISHRFQEKCRLGELIDCR
jgi:hypothetical protein